MIILKFEYTDQSDIELEHMNLFCDWLCDLIYANINTPINKKKISLRIDYLMTAKWISWNKNAVITATDIISLIRKSMIHTIKEDVVEIKIDGTTQIPNSNTLLERLLRFLEYGDINTRPTNMFHIAVQELTPNRLFYLWNVFINRQLGRGLTDIKFKV